ncbi:MAG: hypothetical protein HQL24_03190 [Candidatus Omnitrophica bacterium]|nr:hypothetical protein [Candidatus Omnitrophota bacterium]
MKKRILILTCLLVAGLQAGVFAAINVVERTGTIKIDMPDGTAVIVNVDQPLPEIPQGAKIEVVNGAVKVATTDNSTVDVIVGDQSGQTVIPLIAGNTANVKVESSCSALIKVDQGDVKITTLNGNILTLKPGDQTRVGGCAEPYTPPTRPDFTLNPKPDPEPDISPVQ